VAFPADPLDATVELAIGADITADPGTWSWTDVTTSIREKQKIGIGRGRRNRIGNFPPTRVSATADNTDGNLCRHNPTSTYFGQLKKNTPMRVSVDNGSGPVVRAAVYVTGFPPSWDPSERDQVVTLNAVGITDRLGRSKPLRSVLFRTMSGVSPGDYVPYQYWPMEDGSSATQAASGLPNGQPMVLAGSASFAADSDLSASDPLVTLEAGASLTATIPAYTDTGQWATQLFVNVPSEPSTEQVYAEWRSTGTAKVIRFCVIPGSPTQIGVRVYDSTGASLGTYFRNLDGSSSQNPSESDYFGQWLFYAVGLNDDFGSPEVFFGATTDTNINQYGGASAGSALGRVTTVTLYGGSTGASFGHLGVFTDAAYSFLTDAETTAAAINGHTGEEAHERMERLCREERVPFTTSATASQAMGPQRAGRLLDLLRECANADQGLLYEDFNFGLTYVSSAERYNLDPALTLAYDSGHILPPWDPTDDDQDYYNEVTAARPNGSSYRAADEDEIAAVGQFADQVNPNVETDAQVADVAGWRLNLGLNDELTWPAVRPKVISGGSLLDDWLATDLGQKVHVTGHPSPLAPDTIRQLVEGYTETLGAYTYDVSVNLSPASPWDVIELDDDDLAKLDTDGSDLTAAVNSSATSLSVATQTGLSPLWTTDGGEMPIPLYVGGEVMSVTAIAAPTTITYGAVGTATHASNASVTPGIPASVAAGNLLIVIAAIRNSGTGVPNTPSGYTRLDVFDDSDNVQVFAKVAVGGDAAPTITFTGGIANATTSAQMIRIAGAFSDPAEAFVRGQAQLNSSAQNIDYPGLPLQEPTVATAIHNAIILYVGWKQDDWTSVASPGTEIAEASTLTGDDQGLVWAYQIQTTATNVVEGSFTVTGGAAAISRGAVFAVRSNVQAFTVTRSVNGVTKSHSAGAAVNVYKPARLAL
jgi:hypothetical protein